MSLLLKDKNGNYFPVIDEIMNEMMDVPDGQIWVTGVKKSMFKKIGLKVYSVRSRKDKYYYSYLVDENKFLEYVSKAEPPITMERL